MIRIVPPQNSRLSRQAKRLRSGVATLETAIILSVTMLLILGCMELSLAVLRQNTLVDAARRAARHFAVRGASASELGSQGPTKIDVKCNSQTSVAGAIRPLLTTMEPSEVSLLAEWIDEDNEPGHRVRVTLRYRHITTGLTKAFANHFDFIAVTTQQIEH